MKNLPINLNSFPFYKREVSNGKNVTNKCGRDFLYYALAYFMPDKFNGNKISPVEIEAGNYFGISVPSWLAWTQLQFTKMPSCLKSVGLELHINNHRIESFGDFFVSILFSRTSYEQAVVEIRDIVESGNVAGVDISIGVGGLLDHVMFVYGFDEENLYIFETTETPIKYSPISGDSPQVMKLPYSEIEKRWTKFGRVWRVNKI